MLDIGVMRDHGGPVPVGVLVPIESGMVPGNVVELPLGVGISPVPVARVSGAVPGTVV